MVKGHGNSAYPPRRMPAPLLVDKMFEQVPRSTQQHLRRLCSNIRALSFPEHSPGGDEVVGRATCSLGPGPDEKGHLPYVCSDPRDTCKRFS